MNGGTSNELLNTMLRGRLSGHFVVCTCTSTPLLLEVQTVLSMTDDDLVAHTHVNAATDQRPVFYIDYVSEVQKLIDLTTQHYSELEILLSERIGPERQDSALGAL
ncbi:hypothetical protein PR003_g20865 [Phytophthora rubi]|uniref:Uncharacterized protein n=1 Tax=Phytophthora rubi TaxID=129364 RepID=A0A6A3JTF4_9STRA|nr:hypothetical protein PF003_g14341 [Phytophthora fragariae]KAE8993760.1 hypothetical protein PR002_g20139 [Phytophthora rubi]KAE8995725.1 hypothetical protein PR001_g20053 [Phytophthora rubi]KAE9307947.1 hypothetical protein PR003_g20865 [Phytophthora rubi]